MKLSRRSFMKANAVAAAAAGNKLGLFDLFDESVE